jgi:GxxExxY protein
MDACIYKDLVYKIVGAAMEVHNELNWGLLEPVYNEALHRELKNQGIESQCEVSLPCYYKGELMDKYYRLDLVVDDIIVELKSVTELIPAHRAQLFNYLRLTMKPIGILFNFGEESLRTERYAFDKLTNECILVDVNMKPIEKKSISKYKMIK